jgi:hypothetical protein
LKVVGENASSLAGPGGLWKMLAGTFYTEDMTEAGSRFTAAWYAGDALQALIKENLLVPAPNRILFDGFNPGSTQLSDRQEIAIFYQIFISMAAVGSMEVRYGAPDSTTFARTKTLGDVSGSGDGWTVLENVDEAACGFASESVKLIDSINQSADFLPSDVQSTLSAIASLYGSALDTACNAGCTGAVTGCGFSAGECRGSSTSPCLEALRNRALCKTIDDSTLLDDKARCAAAGIAQFMSDSNSILSWGAN